MLILGGVAMQAGRDDVWTQAEQAADRLLLTLDSDIGRNITILDQSLTGLIDVLAEPGLAQASPGVRHHALFDRAVGAEVLGSLIVLDREGEVVEDSTSIVPHRLNLGERGYFKVHEHNPDAGLYVSRAYKSRIGGGDLRFALTRRVPDVDGKFAGVVSATLRLSSFLHSFEQMQLGRKSTITLLRTDGHILIRYPFKEEDVDADVRARETNFARLASSRSGQYVGTGSMDGVQRLYTFRRIGDLPLILTVDDSTDEIFAPWRRKAVVIGPVNFLLCMAAVTLPILFRREMMRRTQTEKALAAAVEQLSALAATDGLTGLSNRRTFDIEFDRAFRRAVRHGTSCAVLMLDADFFKLFNDVYGHLAGDDVLRAIAACMGVHLQRPDDMKARYGGEEFVAVLSDISLEAAHSVADRIRIAVEGLRIVHAGSPLGYVTVSIGVATVAPLVGFVADELLKLADQALYAAKRDGKNCVCSLAATGRSDLSLCSNPIMALGSAPQTNLGVG